jgi:cytochrome P450
MAGFDSTSNTLAFALHLLAQEPEIQELAYEEVMREIGDLVLLQ